jgi:hypothetical protein
VKSQRFDVTAHFQFAGQGTKLECVITFKGALKLAMLVSGENSLLSISTFRFYPHATPCQIERQTAAIAHLNSTIRAKDAQLARVDDAQKSIHVKLDALLARGV